MIKIGIGNILHPAINPMMIMITPPRVLAYNNPIGPKNTLNKRAPAKLLGGNTVFTGGISSSVILVFNSKIAI
jgi:hypothetical protein